MLLVNFKQPSLSELECKVLICILFHNLSDGQLEVFLCDVYAAFPESEHAGLRAHGLGLGTGAAGHQFARVDLKDVLTRVLVRVRELNLTVDTARTEQGIVQDIYTIGCHDNLDVGGALKTVQLIKQL
jgi:hypothetical protein